MIELDSMEVKWKGLGNRITNGEEKGKNARDKERRGESDRENKFFQFINFYSYDPRNR